MKIIRPTAISGLAALILLFCAGLSFAGSYNLGAEAVAKIDWDTVRITFTGNGGESLTLFESTADMTGFQLKTNPLEVYYESVSGYAWGETDINDSTMGYQDIYAAAGTFDPVSFEFGYADAGYYGQYQAATDGVLSISMEYSLYAYAEAGTGEEAYAEASAEIFIRDRTEEDFLMYYAMGDDFFEDEVLWETLSLSVDLEAGETVNFGLAAIVYADAAPVPLPGAIFLLGSGILVLAGIGKKHA